MIHVQGLIMKPTLFFSDDGVSFLVEPKENWFVSEVLDRIVSIDTKKVYSIELYKNDRDNNPLLRRIELSARLDEIERRGVERMPDKTLVYER